MDVAIRPALTPAPAAAPPRQPAPDGLDDATATLLLPIVDMVVSLAAGNGDAAQSTVKVSAGEHSLEYTIKPQGSKIQIDGNIDGEPLAVTGSKSDETQLRGQTPAGEFTASLQAVPGGFNIAGQSGEVAFQETMALDPLALLTGHIADIEGKIAGETLTESLQVSEDGGSVKVTGKLGNREINETVTEDILDGTVTITGTIGDIEIEQIITRSH